MQKSVELSPKQGCQWPQKKTDVPENFFLKFKGKEAKMKCSALTIVLVECERTLTFGYVYGTAQLESLESRMCNLLEDKSLQLGEMDETGAGQGDGLTTH